MPNLRNAEFGFLPNAECRCKDLMPTADRRMEECRMPNSDQNEMSKTELPNAKFTSFLFGPRPKGRGGPNRILTETVKSDFERPTVSVWFGLPNLGRSLPILSQRIGFSSISVNRQTLHLLFYQYFNFSLFHHRLNGFQ